MLARELKALAEGLKIEKIEQLRSEFTLWHHPEFDHDRTKQTQLFKTLVERTKGKKVLEIGHAAGGHVIPHSTVLDLYDNRADLKMDACDMKGIKSNSYDAVVCISVLEHIPRFWLAAAEIQRILKMGGVVWVGVPTVWPYHPGSCDKKKYYGGDYWRMNDAALIFLFDRCQKIGVWYIAANAKMGDDPRSGWGVTYLGEKVR
jgi:hypothetical protein